MNIKTNQNLAGQSVLFQQAALRYSEVVSEGHEAKSQAVSRGDRVEISPMSQYTANLIFDKIAAKVAEKYGDEAAELIKFDSDLDTSPQATAERIFTFATGFYQKYAEQHSDEDAKEVLSRFMTTIRNAVDQGFQEAQKILAGLSGFTPEIEDVAKQTYQQLQEMLDRFEQEQPDALNPTSAESQASADNRSNQLNPNNPAYQGSKKGK